MKYILSSLGIFCIFSTTAFSQILTSNFATSTFYNQWSLGMDLAVSITTDSSASMSPISQLRAYGLSTVMNSSDYNVSFWSDQAGSPGSKVNGTTMTYAGAMAAPAFHSGAYIATYTSAGFTLMNDTTYWLVFDVATTSSPALNLIDTTNTMQTGWILGDITRYNYGSGWQTWNSTLVVELSSIPEPNTTALLLAGGALLLWRRSKKSNG